MEDNSCSLVSELYFLIAKFLEGGPLKETSQVHITLLNLICIIRLILVLLPGFLLQILQRELKEHQVGCSVLFLQSKLKILEAVFS